MNIPSIHDLNPARRALRALLLEASDAFKLPALPPHSFDTRDLLEFASRLERRRAVRQSPELHLELLSHLGVTACLAGELEAGRESLARGLRKAAEGSERALFRYLGAMCDAHRSRRDIEARAALETALVEAEAARRLRTEIRIALGRVCRRLGDYGLAARLYREVIDAGVHDYRATALHFLAMVRLRQKRLEEAKQLANEGLEWADTFGDFALSSEIQSTLGDITQACGQTAAAVQIYEPTAREQYDRLDTRAAAKTFHNLAASRRKLKAYQASIDAYAYAIRLYAVLGDEAHLSHCFRNAGHALAAGSQPKSALAAFQQSLDHAVHVGSLDHELLALASVVEERQRIDLSKSALGRVLGRARYLVDTHFDKLSRPALSVFAKRSTPFVGASVGAPVTLRPDPLSITRTQVDGRLVASSDFLDRALRDALGAGLSLKHAPGVKELEGFLMLFAGNRFQYSDYASEFTLTPPQAKPHLRELRERGIVELSGERKGAAYTLSFHR